MQPGLAPALPALNPKCSSHAMPVLEMLSKTCSSNRWPTLAHCSTVHPPSRVAKRITGSGHSSISVFRADHPRYAFTYAGAVASCIPGRLCSGSEPRLLLECLCYQLGNISSSPPLVDVQYNLANHYRDRSIPANLNEHSGGSLLIWSRVRWRGASALQQAEIHRSGAEPCRSYCTRMMRTVTYVCSCFLRNKSKRGQRMESCSIEAFHHGGDPVAA
jgi:hypothetical protein